MWLQKPGAWTISSHLNDLLPSLAHTLLLVDVRWCRGGVWTAEMFIEWRKLGDAMCGLAGLVMLENDQETGEHGVFWGRGCKGRDMQNFSELCGHPGSQKSQAYDKRALYNPVSCGTVFLLPNLAD